MTSLDVTCVWKASQVAFGCTIRYSWAFLFNPVYLSPLTVNSMYLEILWFCWLSLSALVPLGSSCHALSTALLTLWQKFLISSSMPRTQFSAVILCLYLSWSFENLSMKAVLIWFQVAASFTESAYHSAAGPRRSEENSVFFLNRYRAVSVASVGLDSSENWFCFQLWVEMILHLDQGRCLRICLEPSQGMILCSRPSSLVSGFVGVYLSTDSFTSWRKSKNVNCSLTSWGLSYCKFSSLTRLWSMIRSICEVPLGSGL